MHFCCGEVKSFSLVGFSEVKSCCKVAKPGCCKDVKVSIKKASEDERIHLAGVFIAQPIDLSNTTFTYISEKEFYVPKVVVNNINAPPPQLLQPIIIKHCVYRI